MDLIGVLRACAQRWWVFLPILALTAWLCASQYRDATPQYTSTGIVVVQATEALQYTRGAQTETGVVVVTPFGSSEGPRVLSGLLARALNTATVRQELLPSGGAALSAVRDVQVDTNVVTITVVAGDPGTAEKSITAVVKGADGVAASIQRGAGVKEGQFLGAFDGGPVDPPILNYPDRVRGAVGIGLAGLMLAVLSAIVVHSLITRRPQRSKKRERKHDPAVVTSAPTTSHASPTRRLSTGATPGTVGARVPARRLGLRSKGAAERPRERPGRRRGTKREDASTIRLPGADSVVTPEDRSPARSS